jgi:L-Ala-D/L-Glu epimerase
MKPIVAPLTIDLFEARPVRLDFKLPVSHNLATRRFTENVIVTARSACGETGYGECVPRTYITGETASSVLDALEYWKRPIAGLTFSGHDDLIRFLTMLGTSAQGVQHPAAVCALELALLDLAGAVWNLPVSAMLGLAPADGPLIYSLVIPLFGDAVLDRLLDKVAPFEFRQVKIKVTADNPSARVRTIRERLGHRVELRVDANCAWNRSNALNFMREMADLDVVSVEQPLAADDLEGSALLRGHGLPLVTLDESVHSTADLDRIALAGAADVINIRISKCGGLLGSLLMIGTAERYGLMVQLGAQVGESSILSAAGAHLAAGYQSFRWLEGCFGGHLLEQDITKRPLQFSRHGQLMPPAGRGLGIAVEHVFLESAESCFLQQT